MDGQNKQRSVSKLSKLGILQTQLKWYKIAVIILTFAVFALAGYIVYFLGLGFPPTTSAQSTNNTPGQTIANINVPLNSSELAAINSGPDSYYEKAGEMLLNLSLPGESTSNGIYSGVVFFQKQQQYQPIILNSKPTVVYVGAISCVFCGENRWAMALALSRFGSFSSLYKGYSALQDADVPTLYWNTENYKTAGSPSFGNHYSSNYINFVSAEYDSPITAGFQFPSGGINYFTNSAPNASYKTALSFMNSSNQFKGTPFTFWGSTINSGADAVVFGTSNSTTGSLPAISYMTHKSVLKQMRSFNNTFAYEEYAAADVYIAEVCPAINNAASACSLPAIKTIESKITG